MRDDPDGIFEYENRIEAWIKEHPAWVRLVWPSYIGPDSNPFNQFRIAPAGGGEPLYGGHSLPEMIAALQDACADGKCGIIHEPITTVGLTVRAWYART